MQECRNALHPHPTYKHVCEKTERGLHMCSMPFPAAVVVMLVLQLLVLLPTTTAAANTAAAVNANATSIQLRM